MKSAKEGWQLLVTNLILYNSEIHKKWLIVVKMSGDYNTKYYKGIGMKFEANEGGIIGNDNSLILLTIMAVLMLFNTIMILKFQFCGIPEGRCRRNKKKYDDMEHEDEISDLTDSTLTETDNDNSSY